MKRLLLLALVITPMLAFAQDKQEYAYLVDKFVQYYNKQQTDSICTMFPDERISGKCPWRDAPTNGTYDIHGKIKTYEYIGEEGAGDREVTIYKIVFSKKGVMEISFHVDENNKFTIFLLDKPVKR